MKLRPAKEVAHDTNKIINIQEELKEAASRIERAAAEGEHKVFLATPAAFAIGAGGPKWSAISERLSVLGYRVKFRPNRRATLVSWDHQ